MNRARTVRAQLVVDADHYEELVVGAVLKAKVSLWIATANLKAMMIEAPIGTRARARGRYVSFFESLADLTKRGVEVRVLHASPPSKPLAAELHRFHVARRQCPRVHLKMIAIDGRLLYLGSANVTGAGLGAKGEGRRNFEMGIVTDDETMLDRSQERFDRIWRGAECGACKLRSQCAAPLDLVTLRGSSKRARRSPSAR
jgi:phosphatidylserine/phosphatidylglycerophosphate/cardiolipin synthase-like enzyme